MILGGGMTVGSLVVARHRVQTGAVMQRSPIVITGMPRLIIAGLIGAVVGALIAATFNPLPIRSRGTIVPAAYRIPKVPGGTPLRLAMVHDILHERYLRHSNAWYARRNLDARRILEDEKSFGALPPSLKALNAMDDIAVGLERLGKYDEGIALLREKLTLLPTISRPPATRPTAPPTTEPEENTVDAAELRAITAAQNLSPLQLQRYSGCANLGTILVHSSMSKALAGDSVSMGRTREGLQLIKEAIAINPGAHFGREAWQSIAIEHLLAAVEHPEILVKYDFIGDPIGAKGGNGAWHTVFLRGERTIPSEDTHIGFDDRLQIRNWIVRVGLDSDWQKIVRPTYSKAMPFDEPTLAIIGMWTLGGGPNPHFALALGRIMENVGQRYIAWNSYERAVEMKERFWPDASVCDRLAAVCRERQGEIAKIESPANPDSWQELQREIHQRELAWGKEYQKQYQNYEAAQIAAGIALDDPTFDAGFFKDRPTIASAPGGSDEVVVTSLKASTFTDMLPCTILGSGMFLMLGLRRSEWDKA